MILLKYFNLKYFFYFQLFLCQNIFLLSLVFPFIFTIRLRSGFLHIFTVVSLRIFLCLRFSRNFFFFFFYSFVHALLLKTFLFLSVDLWKSVILVFREARKLKQDYRFEIKQIKTVEFSYSQIRVGGGGGVRVTFVNGRFDL